MNTIDDIKLRLTHFIRKNTQTSGIVPTRFYASDGKVFFEYTGTDDSRSMYIAESDDGFNFAPSRSHPQVRPALPCACVVPELRYHGMNILFFGDRKIQFATLDSSGQWMPHPEILVKSTHPTELAGAYPFEDGTLLVYYEKIIQQGFTTYALHCAYIDSRHPTHLLWQTTEPLWRSNEQWKNQSVQPLGAVKLGDMLMIYVHVNGLILYGVHVSGFIFDPHKIRHGVALKKHAANPIISPRKENQWEAFNTLNPAALQAGGKIHLLYRAQGYNYISSVGYAVSPDGISIEKRSNKPVYSPTEMFECNQSGTTNPVYVSAGGFGGCEDPRVTLIDDTVYMVYVAYDGWSPPRLAMTSIQLKDFLRERWNWSKPVLISPPDVVDKSGCLFPEKINNKYVFMHRVFPDILIDFVDNLHFDGRTSWLKGEYRIKVRPGKWDSRKIGAGAPPIKTTDGWLLIYYGVDDKNASKYHIGAMLLDLQDPTKVLYRSNEPILSPSEGYEMNGFKPGIAYPCGAVVIRNELLVYYGGADQVVCVATADLADFLQKLKSQQPMKLQKIQVREILY